MQLILLCLQQPDLLNIHLYLIGELSYLTLNISQPRLINSPSLLHSWYFSLPNHKLLIKHLMYIVHMVFVTADPLQLGCPHLKQLNLFG